MNANEIKMLQQWERSHDILVKRISDLVKREADLERAICLWVRDNAGSKISFASEEEAIRWFIEYTDMLANVSEDPDKPRTTIEGFYA